MKTSHTVHLFLCHLLDRSVFICLFVITTGFFFFNLEFKGGQTAHSLEYKRQELSSVLLQYIHELNRATTSDIFIESG